MRVLTRCLYTMTRFRLNFVFVLPKTITDCALLISPTWLLCKPWSTSFFSGGSLRWKLKVESKTKRIIQTHWYILHIGRSIR